MAKGTCGLAVISTPAPEISTKNETSPGSKNSEFFWIDVDGATLSYAGTPLFSDLHFRLEPGSWTCLLGPSGVGKSSLLRVIASLQSLEHGHVVCSDGGSLKGRLAWMGQQDGLLPWLTTEQNVLLGSRLRREAPDRKRAAALLKDVGMEEQASQMPATLSGGQRQRAALARTLMEDRPVVLMDEPFSSLDAITRTRLQGLASSLLRDRTVLLVTHDPLEALRLGHRIYVMAGRPAVIDPAMTPNGEPPRALDDQHLLARQADLLTRLASAQDLTV
jgi:putative hydroxymethylpyrimidine transport system ATP-binding protein